MRTIAGILTSPGGSPISNARLTFVAVSTSIGGVPRGTSASVLLSEGGAYSINIEPGEYEVILLHLTTTVRLGSGVATTGPMISLPEFLQIDELPPSIAQALLDRVIAVENTPPGSGLGGVDPGAGIGVTPNGPSRVLVTNLDRGSTSVAAHVETPDPHPGKYDAAGTAATQAASAVAAHTAADDPHPGKYDVTGAAAGAVSGHVAESDPHPGKYAAQAVIDALIAALDTHGLAIDEIAAGLLEHEGLTTTAHGGIVAANDTRLTNARTPTAHAASHATGQPDAISPASIGAEVSGAAAAVGANLAAHAAATTDVHGIPNTAELVASSTVARVERVTAYPDPEIPGVLYVLLPP